MGMLLEIRLVKQGDRGTANNTEFYQQVLIKLGRGYCDCRGLYAIVDVAETRKLSPKNS